MSEKIIPRHDLSSAQLTLMTHELLTRLDSPGTSPGSPPRRRVLITTAVAACVATAAVASVPLLSTPVWAASSDALSGNALRRAQLDCSARLSRLPNAGQLDRSPQVLAEKRGSTTSTLLISGMSLGVCVGNQGQRYGALVDRSVGPGRPGAVSVDLAVTGTGPDPTGVVAGEIGAEVASVTLRTSDGRAVAATTVDGYFLAWWPSAASLESLTARRSDGSQVTSVDAEQLDVTGVPDAQHS